MLDGEGREERGGAEEGHAGDVGGGDQHRFRQDLGREISSCILYMVGGIAITYPSDI